MESESWGGIGAGRGERMTREHREIAVPKTLSPASSQTVDSARTGEANFDIRETSVFGGTR